MDPASRGAECLPQSPGNAPFIQRLKMQNPTRSYHMQKPKIVCHIPYGPQTTPVHTTTRPCSTSPAHCSTLWTLSPALDTQSPMRIPHTPPCPLISSKCFSTASFASKNLSTQFCVQLSSVLSNVPLEIPFVTHFVQQISVRL